MNRRGFLRFIFTAPIVGPAILKSLVFAEPVIRFVSPTTSATINRWANALWTELPDEIYWTRLMRDGGIIDTAKQEKTREYNITFTLLRKLHIQR